MNEHYSLHSQAVVSEQNAGTMTDPDDHIRWWRGAIIYQVYPRSLYDTNNDGVGDLPGIMAKLDYIASLGVDGIWISPFFKSPMKDFGYDVSDFRDVDPLFGTLEDFDALIAKAHSLGIKVMIDQVLSHTSDQHAWFQESRSSRENPRSDWYVWADAAEDGGAPNNWLAIFGGSAWEWEPQRQQYYMHNFLTCQPDLNFHCEEVRQQILNEVEFWLKRGVDGIRLDAINFCYHDKELRSNPFKPEHLRKGRGFSPDNPYAAQTHLYDNTQPENLGFLESLRELLDRYPGTVSLGEINSENSLETMAEYTQSDKRLHMGYSFELLASEFSADYIRETVSTLENHLQEGWPCWSISNHDVERVVSRWGTGENGEKGKNEEQLAKMLLALAATLRGTICTYQGEELGLTEAPIDQHQLQDPFGIEFWPEFKGRDGCRTPMPWTDDSQSAGFSKTKPWLPIPDQHLPLSVSKQEQDETSVLSFYRALLSWRKNQPALVEGSIEFVSSHKDLLMYKRHHQGQNIICGFNLGSETLTTEIPAGYKPLTYEYPLCQGKVENQQLVLEPQRFCFLVADCP